ncbi:MAG TPA: hypothetical protein VHM70_11260 [Polyangiaceae bacterium]|nr:hypothetical protein [Polyangiaceae bacterium]
MTSLNSWLRLEPQCRNPNMNTGLQARVYDPLWFLARQWQVGEFQGEDNGSPIKAAFTGESARFTRYTPSARLSAPVTGQAYDGAQIPLEALVERERVRDEQTPLKKLRLAVEAGQHFLRILGRQTTSTDYAAQFKTKFAFSALSSADRNALDPASVAYLDLMMPRVPDGRKLYTKLLPLLRPTAPAKPSLPTNLTIAAGDVAEVQSAGSSWLDWYEHLFSEPGTAGSATAPASAWLPERMEYGFSLGSHMASGERVLSSREYFSGHLDWQDFNVNEGAALGAVNDAPSKTIKTTLIPAPVSYRGMPAVRFWEFEDASVDLGAIDAGPEDLARMLLIEFAISYGNDWFVLPLELEVGSLFKSSSLVISNTFGEQFLIRSANESGTRAATFRMFQLSNQPSGLATPSVPDANLFLLAPSHWTSHESRPLEEVHLLRDEMANLAWGVERIVESATEQPLNRLEQQADVAEIQGDPQRDRLLYRLATQPPDYWIPLLPVKHADGLRLKRGRILAADGSQQPVAAKGNILVPDPKSGLELYEEEVPREGARVTRSYQLARWQDGSTHLWIGRRKRVGRGEGSSGLAFDKLR